MVIESHGLFFSHQLPNSAVSRSTQQTKILTARFLKMVEKHCIKRRFDEVAT